jgi:type I restriction enzyme M protein
VGKTLFIDARKLGVLVDRVHRDLTDEEIARIAGKISRVAGREEFWQLRTRTLRAFARAPALDEIKQHGYVLTPGRYVGAEELEEDDEPFQQKMKRLTAKLEEQFAENARLTSEIRSRLTVVIND